ncbi:CinA family nicotinamide mononucleotide deamidase-related protein [Vibrio sp. TH_r3]|uniref:CinA family nicotinamide mononucleotide deamidase-related protein n=1 Tax=Vibrio sp. TH_r3 TaxID=3082084 RepID=UPI00295521F2|nr:CinA family nicotinamide mononucleotide deamidase-related protein [Vibrio sp. TH_r3]MDV7102864.1 CinA family nicotinamide mononucleotide deamidase-related protein [Vibrio sp. TH_r3]
MINIAMLSTGEEVLHGDIIDTNAAWLSRRCYDEGFSLSKRTTVGDQKKELVNELVALSLNHDVVIVNGGLGPTSDDLTSEAAAIAADTELELFSEWLEAMEKMFARTGRKMHESNLKQAMLPKTSQIVNNPVGTACGFTMQINNARFFFTPGVPSEFKVMVNEQILPSLKRLFPENKPFEVSRLYTFGLGESGIAMNLDNIVMPEGFELGYRSYLPFIEVKLFGPADQPESRIDLLKIIYSHLGDNVVSVDEPMLENLGSLLIDSNKQVSVAECATGGYLSSSLQLNEKTCGQFKQAWVLNKVESLENTDQDPIASALALAASIREKTVVDIGLSIGSIMDKKFAIALSTPLGEWGQLFELRRQYDREDQAKIISTLLLDMLRRHEEKKPIFGQYGSVERIRELYIPVSHL